MRERRGSTGLKRIGCPRCFMSNCANIRNEFTLQFSIFGKQYCTYLPTVYVLSVCVPLCVYLCMCIVNAVVSYLIILCLFACLICILYMPWMVNDCKVALRLYVWVLQVSQWLWWWWWWCLFNLLTTSYYRESSWVIYLKVLYNQELLKL